jgi:hypothetical protein
MIPDEIIETMPDLLRTAIEIADTFRDELIAEYGTEGHGAFTAVKARIEKADVAVAVWPDNAAVYKVGYCVLKGGNIIREYLATGDAVTVRLAGIPCKEVAQAAALFQEVGERSEQ